MPETIEHGFFVKDVKHISRNDGNLIGVVLHTSFDVELWARLGEMLDDYFSVAFTPEQGELGLEGGEEEGE